MGLSDLGLGAVKSKARRFGEQWKLGWKIWGRAGGQKTEGKENEKEKGLSSTLVKVRVDG